jgi:hypothetical protein
VPPSHDLRNGLYADHLEGGFRRRQSRNPARGSTKLGVDARIVTRPLKEPSLEALGYAGEMDAALVSDRGAVDARYRT